MISWLEGQVRRDSSDGRIGISGNVLLQRIYMTDLQYSAAVFIGVMIHKRKGNTLRRQETEIVFRSRGMQVNYQLADSAGEESYVILVCRLS
jgi:hypothetical protein